MSESTTDFPFLFEMTTEEFNQPLGGLDYLWDPLPFVEMPENSVGPAGQLEEVSPTVMNGLTETGSLSTTSSTFNPPEGQMEYPSPQQEFKPLEPYFAAAQGNDRIINDRFIGSDNFFDDHLFPDQPAPYKYVPRMSSIVNNSQDDMNPPNRYSNSRYPNQAQRSGTSATNNNTMTKQHRPAQTLVQPGSYQQVAPRSYSSTRRNPQSPHNHGYAIPKTRPPSKLATPAPDRCKPSSSGPRTAPINASKSNELEDVIEISSDPQDPEDLVIPSSKSQKALQAERKKVSCSNVFLGYDPAVHYQKLPKPPARWDVFKYNKYGELTAGLLYSAPELRRYLFDHPIHQTSSGLRPMKGGLTLWIQQNPFDSLQRRGNLDTARCRFLRCSGYKNTIKPGDVRVAFDEHTKLRHNHDPQHNAGYVHLFCLERFMDFPDICSKLDIRAENRCLPLEPYGINAMHLETVQEFSQANSFIESCRKGRLDPTYPHYQTPGRPFEGTLLYKMAMEKAAAGWVPKSEHVEEKGYRAVNIFKNSGNLERETQAQVHPQKKEKKQPVMSAKEEPFEDDEETIENEKYHAQLRKWALHVVCQDKKKPAREKNARAKADVAWARKYLKSNPTRNQASNERLEPKSQRGRPRKYADPLPRPTKSQAAASQLEEKAIMLKRSARDISSNEESGEECQPKRIKRTKPPVHESEERVEEFTPRRSKRGRSPDEENEEESEEELRPRHSKRARRTSS